MREYVIYTAIVGGYDSIFQPYESDNRFDYILFSNDLPISQMGIWQIRKIPYSNPDPTRIARWVKTHPEELLPEYSASIWIDGNIVIKTKYVYSRIIELIQGHTLISSMWHNERHCLYEEAEKLISIGWEQENIFLAWLHFLKKKHYPANNGLWETNFLFRVHSNIRVKELDYLWWTCIDNYSRRDQISFPYVLWKTHLECPFFLSDHENVRNSSHFRYVYHDTGKSKRLSLNKNTIFYYYNKLHESDKREQLFQLYRKIAVCPNPSLMAFFVRQYFRLKLWLSYLKTVIKQHEAFCRSLYL